MSITALNLFGISNGGPNGWPVSFAERGAPQLDVADDRGFGFAVRLAPDVGYVEIRSFRGGAGARERVAAVLERLAGARALILDLRRNHGGDRSMVALFTSMLFDTESMHRDAVYARTAEAPWSLALAEARCTTQQVYVLVSRDTDSLGQAFAANLQRLGRGLVVGESGPRVTANIQTAAETALGAAYRAATATAGARG
jgi:Peptidase family S41